jgi:hypothetical protein
MSFGDCPICLDAITNDSITLYCTHIFHKDCILNWRKQSSNKTCPLCRSIIRYPPTQYRNIQKYQNVIVKIYNNFDKVLMYFSLFILFLDSGLTMTTTVGFTIHLYQFIHFIHNICIAIFLIIQMIQNLSTPNIHHSQLIIYSNAPGL